MTETNHGSNVKGIETTAYNHKTKHLLFIHHMKRRKKNTLVTAVHGQMATVFAKLIIGETDYGVNALSFHFVILIVKF
jgi:acyl-CoA oxidase